MLDCVLDAPEVLLINPRELSRWAARIKPFLTTMANASGGRYLDEDILNATAHGHLQLWVVIDEVVIAAVVITEFVDYPRCRSLRYSGLVGKNWKRWVHLSVLIDQFARMNGCKYIEAFAPLKFGHMRPDMSVWLTMFEKEL